MALIFGFKFLWRKYGPHDAGIIRWLVRQIQLFILRLFVSEARIRIEFYDRFLLILSKQGLTRRPSQTPLEFAVDIETRLSTILAPSELSFLPENIATNFYRVRYGNEQLTHAERSAISMDLDRLKSAVKKR